jgi:hypothetical protein
MKAIGIAILSLLVLGALTSGGDDEASEVEARLAIALAHFENAELQFGPSSTPEQLVQNAGWVDRMWEAVSEANQIELTGTPELDRAIQAVRSDLMTRYQRRVGSLEVDSEIVEAMQWSQLDLGR